jgi:hypothetical protein
MAKYFATTIKIMSIVAKKKIWHIPSTSSKYLKFYSTLLIGSCSHSNVHNIAIMVQPMLSRDKELVQQLDISLIPTVVWVNTNLPQLIYAKVLFTNH